MMRKANKKVAGQHMLTGGRNKELNLKMDQSKLSMGTNNSRLMRKKKRF
jgi:hypothetical protein